MKAKGCSYRLTASLAVAVLAATLTAGSAGRAMSPAMTSAQPVAGTATLVDAVEPNSLETLAFTDSVEARMLHQAYKILATGDHDYNGHRVKAMHEVEDAAKILGLKLSGDRKDRTPQVLSDVKLREAQGLIRTVRNSAEVKDQERVTRHLDLAIGQLDIALGVH